ncbi:MAG: hypothetical protein HYX94_13665 [Chloroflexi bacterium]|nr:hypothetical protein [Chloroflexota bacterium]
MAAYPHDESHPSEEQYPTIASSANFEVWEDRDEDAYIFAFNLNGVTIAVDRELLAELRQVVDEAAEYDRSRA